MENKLNNISEENINEWLGSLGYFFPINPLHKHRFEVLYSNFDYTLTNNKVDVDSIINGTHRRNQQTKTVRLRELDSSSLDDLKMVARKGEELPKNIIDKMKKNQKDITGDK